MKTNEELQQDLVKAWNRCVANEFPASILCLLRDIIDRLPAPAPAVEKAGKEAVRWYAAVFPGGFIRVFDNAKEAKDFMDGWPSYRLRTLSVCTETGRIIDITDKEQDDADS